MQNYKMIIEYDGTRYQGFQNKGSATITAKLQEAILRLTGESTVLHAAVRTSPGVHASGQTVSFHLEHPPGHISSEPVRGYPGRQAEESMLTEFRQKLNRALPQDIVIRQLYPAEERFDAALHLRSATFVCRLDTGAIPNPFYRNYTLHLPEPLDMELMSKTAKLLSGRHDFACFSAGRTKKSTVRCITELSLSKDTQLHQLIITITADGFLRHMPQLLVGTLIDVGTGKLSFENAAQIFEGSYPCGEFLPSKAFCLTETDYV